MICLLGTLLPHHLQPCLDISTSDQDRWLHFFSLKSLFKKNVCFFFVYLAALGLSLSMWEL